MAYLPDFSENLAYMKGEETPSSIQISSGAGGGVATGDGSPAPVPSQASQNAMPSKPATYQQTQTGSRVLGAYQSGIAGGHQDVAQALQTFQEQAGPTRTFESIGGAGTLQQAIETPTTGQDYAERMTGASNILGSAYTGPLSWTAGTAKSAEQVAATKDKAQELQQQAQALQSGYGVSTLIQKQNPYLTPGQLRYEAQQVTMSPEYRAYQTKALEDVGKLWEGLSAGETTSAARAGERIAEEKAIGEAATGYLQGQRQETVDAWESVIAQKQAEQKALDEAWAKFQQSGNLEDLRGLPEWARATYTPEAAKPWEAPVQWSPEQFNTQARQDLATAQQTYQNIMNDPKYGGIADIPILNLKIDSHGREQYDFSQVPANLKTVMAGIMAQLGGGEKGKNALNNLLVQRQHDLEAAGFSPGSVREAKPSGGANMYDVSKAYGKYATYIPLYYAGDPQQAMWQPEDYRFYLQMNPGTLPTRENLATKDQKTLYNNVQTLLEEVDRIGEDEPFRAAQVAAEVDKFLNDEEAILSSREEALKGAAGDWAKTVHQMRRKYEKAKRRARWGKILRIVGGVAAFATGGLGAGLLAGVGPMAADAIGGTAGKVLSLASGAATLGGLGSAIGAVGAIPSIATGALPLVSPTVREIYAASKGKNQGPSPVAETETKIKTSSGK